MANLRFWLLLLCTTACAAGDPLTPRTPSGLEAGSGQRSCTLAGTIRLAGEPPGTGTLQVQHDLHTGEVEMLRMEDPRPRVGSSGGIAYAVVVVDVPGATPGSEPARTARYRLSGIEPSALVVRTGGSLRIENGEPDHSFNVHTSSVRNPAVNRTLAAGETIELEFPRPERSIRLGCDVHPWLQAWVHVVDSPYWALTDPDGGFSIEGLPPGEYDVRILHGTLQDMRRSVTLTPGERAELDVSLES